MLFGYVNVEEGSSNKNFPTNITIVNASLPGAHNFKWATAHYKIRFQMGQTYLNILKYLYIMDYSTFEYSNIYLNIFEYVQGIF